MSSTDQQQQQQQQQAQASLPPEDNSEFLVVGNVDDKASFSDAIRSGHTSKNSNAPIVPGERHMVLMSRDRFLAELINAYKTSGDDSNQDSPSSSSSSSAKKSGEALLLEEEKYWEKTTQQCLADIARQDTFVCDKQVQNYVDFSLEVTKFLKDCAEQKSNNTTNPQETVSSVGDAAANRQGWIGWGVNIALRTASLGMVGTSTFTGKTGPTPLAPALAATLQSEDGRRVAFRIAVATAQQGALAIILDGITAQFSQYEEQVQVGEVSKNDQLPASAPTRRSCVVVKAVSDGTPVVEVRKLLRLFRITSNGDDVTMFFVHTLLTVPLLPQGRHEVCLEWFVSLPPAIISKVESGLKVMEQQQQQQSSTATASSAPAVVAPQRPEPIPLIQAEQQQQQQENSTPATSNNNNNTSSAAKTTDRALTDSEIARRLQEEMWEDEKRMREEQMRKDAEMAAALKDQSDEIGTVEEISPELEQTLLEEAMTNRRRRNNRQQRNNNNHRRNSNSTHRQQQEQQEQEQQEQASSSSSQPTKCSCLGASSGYHRLNCPLRQS